MEKIKKILLAEDDEYISKAYKVGLEEADFIVIPAFNGEEAIEKLKIEKPDLILLDLIMPIKNGFDVLRELKKNAEWKNIPVLILSNLGQDSDIEEALKLGAKDYLVKANFSMKEVIEKIKEYF